jgi:uncharacterized Zn-binding protein involved in type VI secretion
MSKPDPQPAARATDSTEHGGEITVGSQNVLINNLGAARLTDYHTCPQREDRIHVGGVISEGSETVIINNLAAARVKDELLCSGPSGPPPKEEEGFCEWEVENGLGREKRDLDGKREDKGFLHGVEVKRSCRAGRPVDESVEGALGKGRATVDVLKIEGTFKAGASYDAEKKEGFGGVNVGGGVSLLEAKGKYESPLLRIPFTDLEIGFEGEVVGSLGTLEAGASLGVLYEDGKYKLAASERAGAIVGQSVKVALVLKTKKSVAPLPPDKINKGSPDVLIG